MTFDRLGYLADEAAQQAEQAYHTLSQRHDGFLEREVSRRVSRPRFRTLAERVRESGAPYGVHTLVHDGDELLLCRHEGVDMWVLPGGGVDEGETFREAAHRELTEEAGVDVDYEGLALLSRVEVASRGLTTWGVMPVYEARAVTTEPEVRDPDGEISDARWFPFDSLPEDTRDREDLLAWWER
ncbi:NUDIX hydrolase [Natronomonas sp. EA1]|uniref:NUDIX hydrolase n=1 Tax=Natronomonas sp. EA1 TaxID=3421655 RepID=UPI003EBE87D0